MIQLVKTLYCLITRKHKLVAHHSFAQLHCFSCGKSSDTSCVDLSNQLSLLRDKANWEAWASVHPRVEGKTWPGVCPACQSTEHDDWHRNEHFKLNSCRCTITWENLKS